MIEIGQTEKLILGRLTEDPELMTLLRAIDTARVEVYLRELLDETQSEEPNIHKIIQIASRLKERREGVQRYVTEAKNR
jgi:hypothetical protein